MKDRFLFRAKDSESTRWRIGNLVYSADADDEYKAIIIPVVNSNMFTVTNDDSLGFERWYLVDENTICQCTGLKDVNDNLIFEGDIVRYLDQDNESKLRKEHCIGVVKYDDCKFQVKWKQDLLRKDLPFWCNERTIEVIGNIYDNPELLESEE